MSHILIVGAGPAGLSAALRLASHGQRVTLAAAKPPIYNRCAGLPGVDTINSFTFFHHTNFKY